MFCGTAPSSYAGAPPRSRRSNPTKERNLPRMSNLALRPYQIEALDAARAAVEDGVRRLVVALPTGCGKTITFAAWTCEALDRGERVCVLVHRDELVQQTIAAYRAWRPSVQVGI